MATSVVFDLIDQLHAGLTAALAGVKVYDGFGLGDDPGDFLMIGVEDPNATDSATSAEGAQQWASLGNRARDEEGTVTCAALSWNGNADQAQARAGAKAITEAVGNYLRADPSLGNAVEGLMWTGFGTRLRLVQDQNETGAMALVVFEIAYKARLRSS